MNRRHTAASWFAGACALLVVAGAAPGQPAPPAPLPVPRQAADPEDRRLELVEFRNMPLNDAMRLLSQQGGVSIVPSSEAGRVSVSLYLEDTTAMTAIEAVAQAHGLVFRRDPNSRIVRLFTPKENQRDLASFREDNTEVFTLLYPNAVNVATAIRDLFPDRVLMSLGANDYSPQIELQARFNRFDLINSRSLGLGQPQNSNGGGFGGGGIGGGGFGGGLGGGIGGGGFGGGNIGGFGGGFGGAANGGGGFGSLGGGLTGGAVANPLLGAAGRGTLDQQDARPGERYNNFTPEEVQNLEALLADPNAKDRKELTDLLSRRRPANIFVTVIKANNQLVVRTSDPAVMRQIAGIVFQLDVPTPVVLLEVKVLSIDLANNFRSVFDYQFTDGVTLAGGFTTANILPPVAAGSSAIGLPTTAGAPGTDRDLIFQVVSANFRARLQLLEDQSRVTELATPLLMTANNEVSRIFVGETRPITTGFNQGAVVTGTGLTNTVISSTPTTVPQDIGTTLLITPNINADRTVTLRILQENSSVAVGGATIPIPNNAGGFTAVPVDIVRRQNLSGTIVAKDGYMLAVGGLIQETVSDVRSEVPVLGKIPYVGFFFRRQLSTRARRELIVLVRPLVLNTPGEASCASEYLVKSLSLHPVRHAPEGATLNSFSEREVAYPIPPQTNREAIFRVHTVGPRN